MAENVTIPKTTVQMGGPAIEPKPAWFKDQSGFVWLRCECGALVNLDIQNGFHAIDGEGNVTPSLHHDAEDCGFHVFAKLDGWGQ